MEDDDLVDAVEELGAEGPLELLAQAALDLLVLAYLSRGAEAERVAALFVGPRRADIGRHDDDGVAEVHRSTVAVGQATVVQDLQQGVEDLRVRLLDLVEEDHLVRPAADCLGELAALIEANVAWRRAEQTAHGVRLHVLGHVQPQQGIVVVEQVFGERLGQLGLAHAGRAEEQERANGSLGIAKSRARAPDGVRDGDDGLVLVDHPSVQRLFEVQQLGGFLAVQALDGHAGPRRDHGRHVFGLDNRASARGPRPARALLGFPPPAGVGRPWHCAAAS